MGPHELDNEAMIVAKIEEIRADIDMMRQGGSASALATLTNSEIRLLEQLREVRAALAVAEPVDPTAEMTDDEIVDGICEAIPDFPDEAIAKLEAAIHTRRTGRRLRVVEGG